MPIIKTMVTYTIIKEINNIALIETADNKIALLDKKTNTLITAIDNFKVVEDDKNSYFILINNHNKVIIYDPLKNVFIANKWELYSMESERNDKSVFLIKSPLDNSIHLFDIDIYGTKDDIFNEKLDDVEEIFEGSKYLILRKSNKSGLYRNGMGIVTNMSIIWDDIRYECGRVILTFDNEEYLVALNGIETHFFELGPADKFKFIQYDCYTEGSGVNLIQNHLVRQVGRKFTVFFGGYMGEKEKRDINEKFEFEADELYNITYVKTEEKTINGKNCNVITTSIVIRDGEYWKVLDVKRTKRNSFRDENSTNDIIDKTEFTEKFKQKLSRMDKILATKYYLIDGDKVGFYDMKDDIIIMPIYTRIEIKQIGSKNVLCLYSDDEYCDIIKYDSRYTTLARYCKIIKEKKNCLIYQTSQGRFGIISNVSKSKDLVVVGDFESVTCLDNRGYCDNHYFVSNKDKSGVYRLGDERLALPVEYKEVKVHRFDTANGYINVAYICKSEDDKYSLQLELADYFKQTNPDIEKTSYMSFDNVIFDNEYILLQGGNGAYLYRWYTGKLIHTFEPTVEVIMDEKKRIKQFISNGACYEIKKENYMPVITRVNNILEFNQYIDYIESPWGTVLVQAYSESDYCKQMDVPQKCVDKVLRQYYENHPEIQEKYPKLGKRKTKERN